MTLKRSRAVRSPSGWPTRRAWLSRAVGICCAPWFGAAFAADAVQVSRPTLAALPKLPLQTMNGQHRQLDAELANSVPLVLNFVFTTCSSSCSAQTAVLAQVQRTMHARGQRLQLASITIDPDNDTPEQLRKFSRRFAVQDGWQFYTGSFNDLLRIQKHFEVYRGNKSAHAPVLLLRKSARAPWVRVEGFPTPDQVLALFDSLPAEG